MAKPSAIPTKKAKKERSFQPCRRACRHRIQPATAAHRLRTATIGVSIGRLITFIGVPVRHKVRCEAAANVGRCSVSLSLALPLSSRFAPTNCYLRCYITPRRRGMLASLSTHLRTHAASRFRKAFGFAVQPASLPPRGLDVLVDTRTKKAR